MIFYECWNPLIGLGILLVYNAILENFEKYVFYSVINKIVSYYSLISGIYGVATLNLMEPGMPKVWLSIHVNLFLLLLKLFPTSRTSS